MDKKNKSKLLITSGLLGVLVVSAIIWFPGLESSLIGNATGGALSTSRKVSAAVVRGLEPSGERLTQLGTGAIESLITALEKRGAKVDLAEHNNDGFSSLQIKVDGLAVSPVVTNCPSCEPIVYEY